jgi:hypothetical protein
MEQLAAHLAVWLMALFLITGLVIWYLVRLITRDTTDHDEQFIWFKRIRK